MSRLRVGYVLLTCAAMTASGALHAQARAPVSKAPPLENRIGPVPCGGAEVACFANSKSRTVALAWAKGLDERGVPLNASARARKSAESERWLRRLAGTFRIEGTYRNHGGTSPVRGIAKCLGVGDGSGVSCEISATWKAARESVSEPKFDEALYDAMQLLVIHFGRNPDTSQIRATVLDYRAVKMHGVLSGDEVAFSGESMGGLTTLVHYSWANSLVTIQQNGDVNLKFAVEPLSSPYQTQSFRLLAQGVIPSLENDFDLQLHREPADQPVGLE